MKELRKASCEDASSLHNSFCSPFSLAELSTAICKLSSSTASDPDQIAYPLLKHLPEPAQLLLLSLFNRSWYSHTFPSCCKPTTIIPTHKPGKPTSSPSSFRPISLTSCISKFFERLILSRLTFHLEWNHLLSTCQAGFRPGRYSLDQILTLSQSIWDGFQKKKPPHRTILASVDFSKAFDSVWHSALFHKLLSLKLPPCFVLWVRSFLSDRRAKVQVGGSRSRSFRIRRGVPQGSVLDPVLFILPLNPVVILFLAPLSLFLIYGPDLGVWTDCWVSVGFLHALIPRKGSGSTTTTTTMPFSPLQTMPFSRTWSITASFCSCTMAILACLLSQIGPSCCEKRERPLR